MNSASREGESTRFSFSSFSCNHIPTHPLLPTRLPSAYVMEKHQTDTEKQEVAHTEQKNATFADQKSLGTTATRTSYAPTECVPFFDLKSAKSGLTSTAFVV